MRKRLSVFFMFLLLPLIVVSILDASTVRKVYPEQALVGNEPPPFNANVGAGKKVPSPLKLFAVGTVVDSTMMDHQSNGTIHQRIATVGDSALHITAMVSPDAAFAERGMKYIYYINGIFTNFGYVEGSGVGDERAGYGAIVSYYEPTSGLGNVAVTATLTNLDSRGLGAHWYDFQDASQGVGDFTPYEAPYGGGILLCDAYLWPSLYITNDATGNMSMAGFTQNNDPCTGGLPDIRVTHKTYFDATWNDPLLLHTLDDLSAWNSGPNIPMLAGADNGIVGVVSGDYGTNIYYWESTDFGVTWGERQSITGFPTDPHNVAPDTSSTEYRPLQNDAIAVSPGGIPHIVWTAYQAQGASPSDSTYTPGVSGLWQYRTKLEHWDPINGITTVYRHPNGLANFAGGTAFSYNAGHPTIGFGPTDDIIYVVHEGFVDSDQDPTNLLYFGDIYVSISIDGGATWSDRVNVTNTPGSDDLYPAIARKNIQGIVREMPGFSVGNADGINDFVMIYQNDDVAGTFMRGDETTANWDMLLVAPVDFETVSVTGIGDGEGSGGNAILKGFALNQNYPNPFNPSTVISYQLAERAQVSIKIHNVRGQMVRKLVNEVKEAGDYSVQWNGNDASGRKVSSGIYLYTLETDEGIRTTKKMVVLK